jgi:hypothetical protein
MSYTDMDRTIDTIIYGKMLIIICGCGLEHPLIPLSNGHSERIVSDISPHWAYNSCDNFETPNPIGQMFKLDHAPKAEVFDLNQNGYVSFDEMVKTALEYATVDPHADVSDKDGMATNFYFGDFNVNDQPD